MDLNVSKLHPFANAAGGNVHRLQGGGESSERAAAKRVRPPWPSHASAVVTALPMPVASIASNLGC